MEKIKEIELIKQKIKNKEPLTEFETLIYIFCVISCFQAVVKYFME